MSRALIILQEQQDRDRAGRWVNQAPVGTRVEFKAVKRTLAQNDKMWAMLTEIARQVVWHGQKHTPDDWKTIFMDGLRQETRVTLSIDGERYVNLGRSTSDLSKDEMAQLLELIAAFGAEHGVVFHDERKSA